MTAASGVAARSDRRPVAGGCYDRSADTTFVTWAGRHEDNYVQAYDHQTRAWSAPVKVGDGGGDSHNYPTIVQAGDGHLLVFRGMHNEKLVMARSARPHSTDGQWTEEVVAEGAGATYPMPLLTANGDIFVFVRETVRHLDPTTPTDLRPVKYVRSSDAGRSGSTSCTRSPVADPRATCTTGTTATCTTPCSRRQTCASRRRTAPTSGRASTTQPRNGTCVSSRRRWRRCRPTRPATWSGPRTTSSSSAPSPVVPPSRCGCRPTPPER